MFTDIVGYTAVHAESEERGLRVRKRHREVLRPVVERYHGDWVQNVGDESLSSFPSAVDAVNCALAIQQALHDEPGLGVRIGIHIGDVVLEEGSLHGDGVNVAARIRPLAEPGGICVSDEVQHAIRSQENIETVSLGSPELKNVGRPVGVFRVRGTPEAPSPVAAAASASDEIRAIAVLPLENLSGDPEQEYFADGMTEALIVDLAKIRLLRVISRTSVMHYKGQHRPLPEIAEELNVDAVIEGTVMRAGDHVRISAQLIDARSDTHLWSERYDRELSDVLALQSDVARAVAEQIRGELTPQELARLRTTRTVDPEAHDFCLRGTLHVAEVSVPDTYKAIACFERAIGRDPEYAEAYLGLASAYRMLGIGLVALPPAEAAAKVRAAAERALGLDDSLARAHAALGDFLHYYEFRWSEAEEELLRGVELSPGDPIVNNRYGLYLANVGRHEEALRFHQKAVDADPLNLHCRVDKGIARLSARDYERAAEEFLEILEVNPRFQYAQVFLAHTYMKLGRNDDAIDAFIAYNRSLGRDEQWLEEYARVYRDAGLPSAQRYWLAAEIDRGETEYVDPVLPAFISSATGDADTTFHWLERAFDARSPLLVHVAVLPRFDPYRADPRFQDLLRRIGFPEG
jgi:TolB-like protein/Tfp pilus assembly protein PilF